MQVQKNTYHPASLPVASREVIVRDELVYVKKIRNNVMTGYGPAKIHAAIIFACILVNAIFFFSRKDYFELFIAASFYLNMYYFILLLIPTNLKGIQTGAPDMNRLKEWIRDNGITGGTLQFTRLFMTSIMINSRALAPGLALVFSIDIVFVIASYFSGLQWGTTLIVAAQCAAIVIFYLWVWKAEPFSTTYQDKMERVKTGLGRRMISEKMVAYIFILGFLFAVLLFLTTIILLPGLTLNRFLTTSHIHELGHLFALLFVLAASQYFIIRFLHGISSRSMAERIFDYKEHYLSSLIDKERDSSGSAADADENPVETGAELLESRIYSVRRISLFGAFPVFVVDLDFSVMTDSKALTAIRGYIENA